MVSAQVRRAVARPTLSLALVASFGFGFGCTPATSAGGSGGKAATGSGGNTTTTGSGGNTTTTGSGGNTTTTGSGGNTTTTGSGGNATTTGTGGNTTTTGSGGNTTTGTGGKGGTTTTGTGGNTTTGSGGNTTTGTGGKGGATTTGTGGSAAGGSGCTNTNMDVINEDASGYVCGNKWGIKGAWYCYSDGSDTTTSCKGSDGKGAGAVPWNAATSAMCLSGTLGTGDGKYVGMGFKVNSGPPGSTAAPGTWDATKIVGFAITLTSGASGKGSGGMILNLEYPTTENHTMQTKDDSPGVTLPGVGSGMITYNVLFADSVLANNKIVKTSVDPTKLTDVKLAFFPDSISHTYDFCIKSIVPLMTAPNPVVATGAYGPTWNNQLSQAVNGVNGYAVQSAPFPMNGNPMTMQVSATAGGVGFTYTTGSGYQAPNNGPGSFPAIISGWGPGHDGIQFYGPYKGGKRISQLTSVKSSWSYTMGASGNAVYDVWFSPGSVTQPPLVPAIELMIWIGNKDKMPIGYGTAAGPALDGRTPYKGENGTHEQVVSYWVPTGTNGSPVSNFDLLPYFKDAASHGYAGLTNDSYLLGVQTGFEVYSGTWTTTDYNITIQ
jgi:hypothetical protein